MVRECVIKFAHLRHIMHRVTSELWVAQVGDDGGLVIAAFD